MPLQQRERLDAHPPVLGQDSAQVHRRVAVLQRHLEQGQAESIAVPAAVLCELVWVLRRVYRFSTADCCAAIETLIQSRSVRVDRPAVDLGLRLLAAGGDFADGVIAIGGGELGADRLVTFDQQAARLLQDCGQTVVVL